MEELENFKHKLIRMVSRLHLIRSLPYEEVWEILNKQTGRDCGALWERMRSITLKKLSRLLAADDRRSKVSPGARMTTTDWLLFDLVLVHEGPDVIGTIDTAKGDGSSMAEAEVAAHRRLFDLVLKQEIEVCSPYMCLRRWEILTKQYNVEGRECSPMLLQLRWYQLKDRARHFFYEFWSAFRGNKTNLQKEVLPPSRPLDIEIARCYPNVVTDVFPTWSELLQKKLVVLPERFSQFAKKMRQVRPIYRANMLVTRASLKPQPANDAEPDIVLVEPQIDTITLDDSDTETTDNQPSTSKDQQDAHTEQENNQELQNAEINSAIAGILGGLEEDGLSNVQILEAGHVPTEEIDDDTPLEQLQEETESPADPIGTEEVDTNETQIVSKVERNISEPAESPNIESPDIPELVDEVYSEILNAIKAVTGERDKAESPNPPDIADEVLKETLNAIKEQTQETVVHDIDSDEHDTLFTSVEMPEPKVQDLVSKIKEEITENTKVQNEESSTLVIGELPSNLEFIDDGIDYVEDSGDDGGEDHPGTGVPVTPASIKTEVNHEAEEIVQEAEEKEEQSKFDLKLMMLPVVYTMKIDYMKCLRQTDYETINTAGIIDTIVEESKPISALSVKIKHEKEIETASEVAPDINTSSDMIQISHPTDGNYPVVHEKNDSEHMIKLTANALKQDIEILIKSELTKETECESDSSDESIPECKRVKLTSGLFRKPRGRTYNPIQLCKNPDFNTRLRRISAGFLSYERNRRYLNRLKPLTIDLHKSFESYLIDKTVYLVPDPNSPKPVSNIQNNSVTTSVLPTALPVQCLLDDTTNYIRRSEVVGPIDEELAHRKNKVIELPDIEKVRRINQYLLTAEVSPIQVRNEPVTPFQEISTIQKYNNAAAVPKITHEPRSNSQSPQVAHESSLHDNHPLLEVPKEGEITTVKVELCDDNDEEENLQQSDEIVPPPQNTTISPPAQNITIAPPPQNTVSAPLLQNTKTVQDTKKVPPVQDTSRVPPAQDTSRVPPAQDTRLPLAQDAGKNQSAVTPASAKSAAGKKEARKSLREPQKRPWYLPNTPTVGSRLEAKVLRDPAKTPWYKQNPFRSIGTSLLTKDSLQRMMLVIDGKDDDKGKKKNKKNTSRNELLSGTCIDLSTNEEFPANEGEVKSESADSKKPDESLTQNASKTGVQNFKKLKFCCWARRMAAIAERKQKGRGRQNNWLPKHKCDLGKCVCCCKEVLEKESDNLKLDQWMYPNGPEPCCWARKMIKIFKERKKYESLRWMPLHNCLQGETKECKCCCKQALDAVAGLVERICKRVKDSDDIKETTKAVQGIKKSITETSLVRSDPATSVVNEGTVPYENILSNYLGIASKGTDAALNDELSILNFTDKSIEIDSNSNESTSDRVRCRTSVQEKPQAGLVQKHRSYTVKVTNVQKLKSACTQSVGTSTESDTLIELSDDEVDSAPTNHAKQGLKDNLAPKAHIIVTPGNIKPVVSAVPSKFKKTVIAPKPKFIIKCFKHLIRACPVRLGPDKILLTTCNLPADLIMPQSNVSTTSTLSPALQPSGLMTNVQLPKGVHLVLDPKGQLACAFEPNVNLDAQSILELKNVVSVIQEQLNMKHPLPAQIDNPVGVAPTPTEDVVTLLSDDEKTDDKPADTETSEVQTTTEPSELCNEVDENEQENSTNTDKCTDTAETNVLSQDSECTSQTAVTKDSVIEGEQVAEDDVTNPETLTEANENISANKSENIAEIQHMQAESTSSNIEQYAIEHNQPNEQCVSSEENSRHSECQVESLAGNTPSEVIPASNVNIQPPDNVTITETATPDDVSVQPPDNVTSTEITTPDDTVAPTEVAESNEVTQENSQEERETPQPMSNKKSILSDLMEMSGISSEDILAPELPEPPVAMPVGTLTPVVVTAGPAEDGPIELTQVTNVAALKYAVAHNAKFYRYTLGTGALAAIEVALQSRQNQPAPVKQLIDLTDASVDDTPAPPAAPISRARSQAPLVIRKVVGTRPPPTITITPPTTSHGPRSLLKRPVSTISIEPNEQPLRRRKQLVDTTIYNLDATDGEMEEEYLLDSEQEDETDPQKTISKLKTLLAKARAKRSAKAAELDPNVSSDDEPLAKKAKRRRRAKKLKKKFKAAKKQLKLIQKAAGTYSIVPESGPASGDDAINYSIVPMDTEAPEGAVAGTTDELSAEPAIFTKTTDALPAEDIPDSVAAELANEGEVWLEPSEDESDNFILGA